MLWLRPETDAGSAGKQPARDTGVAADDRPCGGLPAPAASRRRPPGRQSELPHASENPGGRRPQGARGAKPTSQPTTVAGCLAACQPLSDPARLRALAHSLAGPARFPSKSPIARIFELTSKTEAFSPGEVHLNALSEIPGPPLPDVRPASPGCKAHSSCNNPTSSRGPAAHATGRRRRGTPLSTRAPVGPLEIEGECVLRGRNSAKALHAARFGGLVTAKHGP